MISSLGRQVFALGVGGIVAAAGCASGGATTETPAYEETTSGAGGAGGADSATASSSGTGVSTGCVPGKQDSCACPGGGLGVQVCKADGKGWGTCACEAATTGSTSTSSGTGGAGGGAGGGDGCGDAHCGDGEDCHTCPADCGECKPCDIAPACAGAQVPPAALDHVADLDIAKMRLVPPAEILARLTSRLAAAGPGARAVAAALAPAPLPGESPIVGVVREALAAHPREAAAVRRQLARAGLDRPALRDRLDLPELAPKPMFDKLPPPGGTEECGAPRLRVRVAKIDVHEEDDDFANDIVYCTLTAEGGRGSEVRVTPQTPKLDEGDSFSFPLEAGVFWGQKEPRAPEGNLLLTYDCFEADSNGTYESLLETIAHAAGKLGAIAGDNGWIFDTIGAVAPVLSEALALDGDDHLYNASQVVGTDKQLDMTNGRWWSIRRAGTHINSSWDWELRIEAWGCAEYGAKPN